MTQYNLAIFIFDQVEVLDFAGPFEVFAVTKNADGSQPFNVYTVSQSGEAVSARNGLSINPTYSFETMPQPDILVVPGGWGTRKLVHDAAITGWIAAQYTHLDLLLSVCTGSLLLGKAGLLENVAATTHHHAFDLLEEYAPTADIRQGERFVDNGKIVTSAGISAGIDMSLHIVARLCGADIANTTADYMEYDYWRG